MIEICDYPFMRNSGDGVLHRLRTRIATAREQAGLSQGELERLLGIPSGAISKIEAGTRDVSSIELASIAKSCGRSLNWFFDEAEDMVPQLRGTLGTDEARSDLAWFNEFADAYVSLAQIVGEQ
jgi:transcriptional regulator with XRE-family HTH domain